MLLKVKPYHSNTYPIGGVLIKGTDPAGWVKVIQRMNLNLSANLVYPLPGSEANSVWGCLVVLNNLKEISDIGKSEYCQLVHELLFIPEKSTLVPIVSKIEIGKILLDKKHFLHPEIGMVELSEPMDWVAVIEEPIEEEIKPFKPLDSIYIPGEIKSFQLESVSPEEVIKNLEQNIFPKKEKLKDEPLSFFEKAKLKLYQQLFKQANPKKEGGLSKEDVSPGVLKSLEALGVAIGEKGSNLMERMLEDFEDLERRNQKEVDKLMDMLKNNPEEALKYAIPLDEKGTFRGGMTGEFKLSRRWGEFSLFGNNRGSGSGGVDLGDHFYRLREQYMNTAKELIAQGNFEKAAFIYMRLLKNYTLAASTLEQGKMYQEAASIYLKHLDNKRKAAECYEKGNYISEAIELYKELKHHEKVGDLYAGLHKLEEAHCHYQMVVEQFKDTHQYVKAALLCRNKMNDPELAQGLLLEGWRNGRDAFNCLNNYFTNIREEEKLLDAIHTVYQEDVKPFNREVFLKAMRYEYKKSVDIAGPVRNIAYEIIAEEIKNNPAIASELLHFNPADQELVKDTTAFKRKNW